MVKDKGRKFLHFARDVAGDAGGDDDADDADEKVMGCEEQDETSWF